MIGSDIVEIARFMPRLEDPRFLHRVFTTRELDYAFAVSSISLRAARCAVRFAAKEAVFKAADPITVLRFQEIEVLKEVSGKPIIEFHGETKRIIESDGLTLDLSLSHCHEYALAVVMATSS